MNAITEGLRFSAEVNDELDGGERARKGLDLAEIKRRLVDERRELISAIAAESLGGELGEEWQERDSPSEDELREVQYMCRDARLHRLSLLDEALERLSMGTYGLCVRCSNRIGVRRLRSDPAIGLCIACARTHDNPVPPHSL